MIGVQTWQVTVCSGQREVSSFEFLFRKKSYTLFPLNFSCLELSYASSLPIVLDDAYGSVEEVEVVANQINMGFC